jgi:GxxExxY protein
MYSNQDYPHQELTGRIIAASFTVFRAFGYGFLESVYRRALAVELEYLGLKVTQDVPYELFHRGVSVGFYRADLVAEMVVLIETKTGAALDSTTPEQVLNYLCAAQLNLGLVVHFGPRGARVKRIVRSNDRRLPDP